MAIIEKIRPLKKSYYTNFSVSEPIPKTSFRRLSWQIGVHAMILDTVLSYSDTQLIVKSRLFLQITTEINPHLFVVEFFYNVVF